ncbi:hypothetical protein AB1Y20_011417 [Prymnesium parvum]|uniref:Solute carrier family 25 member 38 homolog n=1 Tax=Prymnesium parvum TaxID=97485 RepID=A0AB34IQE9_PRYPA
MARLERLAAGLIAGLLSTLLLQPLEVLKSRLQREPPSARAGYVPLLRRLVRQEGARVLWAGALPASLRVAGGMALYFLFLGEAEAAVRAALGQLEGGAAALATVGVGGACRGLSMAVFCPLTVLKTRAEARGEGGGGLARELRRLASTEGLGGLFAGLGASLLRDVPYAGLNLWLLRSLLASRLVAWLPHAAQMAAAAAAAAAAATFLTQPADVARTEQVLQQHKEKRRGIAAVLLNTYQLGGLRALYVGVGARVTMRAIQQAISWCVFEVMVGR